MVIIVQHPKTILMIDMLRLCNVDNRFQSLGS